VAGPTPGSDLLAYLCDRFPHSSRESWRARIDSGQVRVDGLRVSRRFELRGGEVLVWDRPPWVEPEAPLCHAVLHRDDDLLAVAKPAGLPTLPGGGFLEHTLLYTVRRQVPHATPLHRLGRWTSGIVLFAISARARAGVAAQLRERRVLKRYRALACGRPASRRFELSVPIGPVPYARLGRLHSASRDGKPARSRVHVVELRDGAFLADVFPITGRPHQIRIHLAAAGHPLAGDPLYRSGGGPASDGQAVPGDGGYHLHAAEMRLRHPRHGRETVLGCSPPPLLRQWRRE
jgi:23S rRNA pseudouridine1911/1915/1917 synthase